jgi:hypothetical protein
MKITPDVFEAYLRDEPSTGGTYPGWVKAHNHSYRVRETCQLLTEFPNNEVALSPDMKNLKAAK